MASFRRHIFFCHGFDRRGPRFFHLWQQREARRHASRFGTEINIGPRTGETWTIISPTARTTFTFCDWSDIVANRFDQPAMTTAYDHVRLGLAALRQGFFTKILRRDWALGLLLAWGFAPFFAALTAALILAFVAPVWLLAIPPAYIATIALAGKYDARLGMAYIAHIAWAARRLARQDDARIEALISRFKDVIDATDADEVLIIGHSIGAALAVRIAGEAAHPTSILTLGQSIPLVALQKEATAIRANMTSLTPDRWIDVSARKDMLGFLAHDPSEGHAACITINLKRAFGEARVRALRWKGFAMHFLYFHANTAPAPWDWLTLISGNNTLQETFKGAKRRPGMGERRLLF